MAEGEDEITDAATIDMMAHDVEARIRFEKRVENMDGLARRGGDDFGMEGSISTGDRRVELDDRVGSVTAVDATGDFAAIAEMDMLSVGRRYRVRTENSGDRRRVLGFDQPGKCQGEGFLPEVPDRHLL